MDKQRDRQWTADGHVFSLHSGRHLTENSAAQLCDRKSGEEEIMLLVSYMCVHGRCRFGSDGIIAENPMQRFWDVRLLLFTDS